MLSLLLSVGVKLHFSGSEVHRNDLCPEGIMLGRCHIHYLMQLL